MTQENGFDIALKNMTDSEFHRLGNYIQERCGIKMPLSKKTMLQGRLQKRVRALKMNNYSAYADFVFSHRGMEGEIYHMIDAVTTNKTDFFREAAHFDYLTTKVLPEIVSRASASAWNKFRFWSAGCSTGEEPYTLAMVLAHFAERHPEFHFSILATDISTRVLENAAQGIYTQEKIAPVPMPMRKKYLLRGKTKPVVRVIDELRASVQFMRLNFMDEHFGIREMMDAVFCRNVIIYFDRPTQEAILSRICRHLSPGGYLFMGHSETLNGMNLPINQVTASIYRK